MLITNPSELQFEDGYLFVPESGIVVDMPKLAEEINTLTRIREVVRFALDNEKEINNCNDRLIFRPKGNPYEVERLSVDDEPKTPLADKARQESIARAEEFLEVQRVKDINSELARLEHLAKWFAEAPILYNNATTPPAVRFESNPFDWTEDDVIGLIKDTHRDDIKSLLNKIDISF